MKIKELRQKTKEELQILLRESQEKFRSLRFDLQLKKLKNVREIRKIKKFIAQILTLLNE